MAYYDVFLLTQDVDFQARIAACYAVETEAGDGENPNAWSIDHIWDMAAAPGFGDAYASAVAGAVENPGRDQAVISDGQILAAVQHLMTLEAPPVEPPPENPIVENPTVENPIVLPDEETP